MIKKVLAIATMIIFLVAPALGCILPGGTQVYLFQSPGMQPGAPSTDQEVIVMGEQPPAEMLEGFGGMSGDEDWSDGIAVYDEDDGLYILVHKKDLQGECEVLNLE